MDMTKLEQFRKNNDYSYRQLRDYLASKDSLLNRSTQTIYRWCRGNNSKYKDYCGPRPKYGLALARVLECTFQDIYADVDPSERLINSGEF